MYPSIRPSGSSVAPTVLHYSRALQVLVPGRRDTLVLCVPVQGVLFLFQLQPYINSVVL